jgi:hypothetical protein
MGGASRTKPNTVRNEGPCLACLVTLGSPALQHLSGLTITKAPWFLDLVQVPDLATVLELGYTAADPLQLFLVLNLRKPMSFLKQYE